MLSNMNKVLITGVAGFVGTNLIKRLLKDIP
jgi:nucleoside-diphosphate-sugar epimerase